ncbi:unnamed protein product, partial [Gadus morhua 'NCC']
YHAVGTNVTLQTGYGGNNLTSVDWNHGENNAVKWFENNFKAYGNFEDRIFLNRTNGDLTLIGVNDSESGEYTVSLNGKDSVTKHFIKVIHHVPVPTVTVNCSPEGELMRFCLYTCAGDTSQSEPVSYEWSLPNGTLLSASNKTINVTMESLTGPHDQLLCTMRNPVNNATATVISPPRSTAPATTTTPHPTSTAPPTTSTAPTHQQGPAHHQHGPTHQHGPAHHQHGPTHQHGPAHHQHGPTHQHGPPQHGPPQPACGAQRLFC